MSIPFGAIVYTATPVPRSSGGEALAVLLTRRSRDGRYGAEETVMLHDSHSQRVVIQALDNGPGVLWGGWYSADKEEFVVA